MQICPLFLAIYVSDAVIDTISYPRNYVIHLRWEKITSLQWGSEQWGAGVKRGSLVHGTQ